MKWYEIRTLLKNSYYREREQWEQARFTAYIIASCNSTKKLKVTDVLKFPWDKEKQETSISDEDIKRLKDKAEKYLKNNRL